MFELLILPRRYFAELILQRFTVRIHSGLIEKGRPWLKLWYFLRGLDFQGSGFCRVSMELICQILGVSCPTVRQWLREGKRAAGFRFWRFNQRQGLRVALGGLVKVSLTLKLGLPGWGTTAEVPLHQIGQLRALATGVVAQRLQQRSRNAAWRALPEEARKKYSLPEPEEFFLSGVAPYNPALKIKASQSAPSSGEGQRPSHDSASAGSSSAGGIRCLIHVGRKRIFVSKGFVPFGTSQKSIAWERNYECDRTIQRHLTQIKLPHKQLVQAKAAYGHIREALRWDAPSIAPEPGISLSKHVNGRIVLSEIAGIVGDKPYTQEIKAERFFNYGDRDWIYRCNLYQPRFQLCTTRASILNYRRLLKKSRVAGALGFTNL